DSLLATQGGRNSGCSPLFSLYLLRGFRLRPDIAATRSAALSVKELPTRKGWFQRYNEIIDVPIDQHFNFISMLGQTVASDRWNHRIFATRKVQKLEVARAIQTCRLAIPYSLSAKHDPHSFGYGFAVTQLDLS